MLLSALLCLSGQAVAQGISADNWQESDTAPPASFSTKHLQFFEVSPGSTLVYGMDPDTLTVGADGVVRYVLVASSARGALNVLYEGIRCQTAEMKTYARWDNHSAWNTGTGSDWRPLSFSGSTRHAMRLARDGVCDGSTPNGSALNILQALQRGPNIPR